MLKEAKLEEIGLHEKGDRRKEKARRGQEREKMSPGVGKSEKLKNC